MVSAGQGGVGPLVSAGAATAPGCVVSVACDILGGVLSWAVFEVPVLRGACTNEPAFGRGLGFVVTAELKLDAACQHANQKESSTCTHRDQVLLQVRDRVVEAALALHRRQMRLQLCEVTLLGMRASGEEQERRRAEAAGGSGLGHVSPRVSFNY